MSRDGIPDPDDKILCPFDNQLVPAKRMQYHLMKCKKNYPHVKYFICPFNACHIHLSKRELRDHISSCPQKAMIEPILTYEMLKRNGVQNRMNKGYTDLPSYDTESVVPQTEDWDEESASLVSRLGIEEDYYSKTRYNDIIRQKLIKQTNSNDEVEKEQLQFESCQTQGDGIGISQAHPQIQQTLSMAGVGRGLSCSNNKKGSVHSNLNEMPTTSKSGMGIGSGMLLPSTMGKTRVKPEPKNEKFDAIKFQIFSGGIGRGRGILTD